MTQARDSLADCKGKEPTPATVSRVGKQTTVHTYDCFMDWAVASSTTRQCHRSVCAIQSCLRKNKKLRPRSPIRVNPPQSENAARTENSTGLLMAQRKQRGGEWEGRRLRKETRNVHRSKTHMHSNIHILSNVIGAPGIATDESQRIVQGAPPGL